MKRIFAWATVLCLAAYPVLAGWNIKQNPDGGTVWENENGVTSPVGGGVMTVELDDISTASTAFIIPHRAGLVKKAYVIVHSPMASASPTVTILIRSLADPTQYTAVTGGDSAGVMTFGVNSDTDSATYDTGHTVGQGQVIAVVTDGGSTGASRATITLVIE